MNTSFKNHMDALSKIFADIHLNHTEYIYLKTQGEWSFVCQDQTALIVYIVLVGSVFIQVDDPQKIKRELNHG